jgi:hypothetical protein
LPPNYALFRALTATTFLIDLAAFLPFAKVCLGRGYWPKHALHGRLLPLVLAAWAAAAGTLALGLYPIVGAAVLWLLFRHIFIANRWKILFRGGGAPGFMAHHTAFFLFLFEAAALLDGTGALSDRVLLVYRLDLGTILLCSGTYKSLSGYLRGEGMEYGLANPFWSYWWRPFMRLVGPKSVLLRLQDAGAALGQVTAGLLLLVPQTRPIGAVLVTLSFLYLIPLIRLGRLAVLMAIVPLLALPSLGVEPVAGFARTFEPLATPPLVLTALSGLTVAYLLLLPIVKITQYVNLFLSFQLPRPIQAFLTGYANFVPIIMWRVFTPDVTNFFVRIYAIDTKTGEEKKILHEDTTYSYREIFSRPRWSLRFLHVTESIALTTVFTTLKYFRSQPALFEERLREYARTLGTGDGVRLRFQYVAILKRADRFEHAPVGDFLVDPGSGEIEERRLVPEFDYGAAALGSHVKETTGFGSYVPKAR